MNWQLIASDALSQIFFIGPPLSSDQSFLIVGYIHAIPAIAAYESWNPMSSITEGVTTRCISKHLRSRSFRETGRPKVMPASLRIMNRSALVNDADAPVVKV